VKPHSRNASGLSKSPYIAVHKPENYNKKPHVSHWGWPDVTSSWTWPGYEGKPIMVDVYSLNSEVELLLNGKPLGRKPAGKPNRYIASFKIVYEPGELVAIGYEKGVEASRTVLRTAGKPANIHLKPDRNVLKAEFEISPMSPWSWWILQEIFVTMQPTIFISLSMVLVL